MSKTASWTDEELDRRHEEVCAKFPDGMTHEQWRLVTLESAREDGIIHPHSLADWCKVYSMLIRLWLDGLIERRCRLDESGPWYITNKGRAYLTPKPCDSDPNQGTSQVNRKP